MSRPVLFVVISVFMVAVAELGALLTTVTPAQASQTQLWLFFCSILATVSILLTPLWYSVKKAVLSQRMTVSSLACLRQSFLFSLVVVVSLFFNSLQILTLWDIIPLCISMILIEFFFQADKSRPTSSHVSPE